MDSFALMTHRRSSTPSLGSRACASRSGPDVIIVAVAVAAPWMLSTETTYGLERSTWHTVFGGEGFHHSLPGLWYFYVAVPIIQYLWYRWLWRIVIWILFLGSVARLNLNLVPSHADRAGGLEFLSIANQSLGIFAFAASCILSADAAFRIVYEGAVIDNFEIPAVALLIAAEIVCLGPLLLFSPIMIRKRRAALHEYGAFVVRYDRAFHRKWLEGKSPEGDAILGSPDIQSFADLGTGFEFVQSMRLVPFSGRISMEPLVFAALLVRCRSYRYCCRGRKLSSSSRGFFSKLRVLAGN